MITTKEIEEMRNRLYYEHGEMISKEKSEIKSKQCDALFIAMITLDFALYGTSIEKLFDIEYYID